MSIQTVLAPALPALAAGLLAAACSGPTTPSGPQGDLEANRQRFRRQVGATYEVEHSSQCFCVADVREPVRLSVRDGKIAGAVRVADGSAVPPERWQNFHTVEAVFDRIDAELRAGRRVGVKYDAGYGYPTRTEIGTLANDAGIVIVLRDVQPRSR